MTLSMTAFARSEHGGAWWEIRSVNQRYIDINFRMPEAYRFLEIELRALVRNRLSRGKLDCTLKLEDVASTGMEIDETALAAITGAAKDVDAQTGQKSQLDALDLLRFPGVIKTEAEDTEARANSIREGFNLAIDELLAMRAREGEALAEMIHTHLNSLTEVVDAIESEAPAIAEQQETRLRERLGEMEVSVNPERIETELVFLAQKSDVREEIDRLRAHMDEVQKTLSSKKPVGRRLDFLMQELNREANTLGAKVSAVSTSLQAVDLKVIIEQMREQVQNIE